MIKAQDLRVGNKLEYFIGEDGIEWDETAIDAQDILWCQDKEENFNRVHREVRITPEKLLDAGFKERAGNYCYEADDGNIYELEWKGNGWNIFHLDTLICFKKYWHELQNLIYALTNEELKFAEEPNKL